MEIYITTKNGRHIGKLEDIFNRKTISFTIEKKQYLDLLPAEILLLMASKLEADDYYNFMLAVKSDKFKYDILHDPITIRKLRINNYYNYSLELKSFLVNNRHRKAMELAMSDNIFSIIETLPDDVVKNTRLIITREISWKILSYLLNKGNDSARIIYACRLFNKSEGIVTDVEENFDISYAVNENTYKHLTYPLVNFRATIHRYLESKYADIYAGVSQMELNKAYEMQKLNNMHNVFPVIFAYIMELCFTIDNRSVAYRIIYCFIHAMNKIAVSMKYIQCVAICIYAMVSTTTIRGIEIYNYYKYEVLNRNTDNTYTEKELSVYMECLCAMMLPIDVKIPEYFNTVPFWYIGKPEFWNETEETHKKTIAEFNKLPEREKRKTYEETGRRFKSLINPNDCLNNMVFEP